MTALGQFIGGTGRCGTSVLGIAFGTHPDVAYFGEPRFINDPGGLYDYLLGRVTSKQFREKMLREFYQILSIRVAPESWASAYTWEAVRQVVDEEVTGQNRIGDGLRLLLALFGLAGRDYWVEKTPHTVRYVDLLYRMFGDDLRYLHLIREPKDILASLMHQKWGPKGTGNFCIWYNEIMGDARTAYGKTPQGCYAVVEMEELVRQPQNVLPWIFRFFEIPADPDWLFDVIKTIRPADAHIGRCAADLSRREQQEINDKCSPLYLWWKGKATKWQESA